MLRDRGPAATVKCVVWDLDDTLWEGMLAEGGGKALRPGTREILEELDRRGVLNSIASKNEPGRALARLSELGVDSYFVAPQISWDLKSILVGRIAEELNIGIDTLLLLDDSPFERAEVHHEHPEMRCVDATSLDGFLDRLELDVPATAEARGRRRMYQDAARRKTYEESFVGPRVEFLTSLQMRLAVSRTRPEDLDRAAELTQRTHQLNTTGLVFDRDQLGEMVERNDTLMLSIRLADRFGDYGMVGLVIVALRANTWCIRLYLMSCRVMGRNVGGTVIALLGLEARAQGVDLTADFVPNDVNRQMYVVYRLAGFVDDGADGPVRQLRLRSNVPLALPAHVAVHADISGPCRWRE